MSWPRALNWYRTFLAGTSSCSSIRSISRLVRTSLETSRQSTSAVTRPGSRSAIHRVHDRGDKSVDLAVAHADDVEAAALGHVDRLLLAQLQNLLAAKREHGEHAELPPDEGKARVGRGNPLADCVDPVAHGGKLDQPPRFQVRIVEYDARRSGAMVGWHRPHFARD